MTVSNIVLRALKKATGAFNKYGLDWCLFGGLAMQSYKRIRATKDIDLMVAVNQNEITKFITRMQEHGFKFDKKRGIIKMNGFKLFRFIYIDEETGFEIFIDLVTAASDFQKQILTRKTKVDFLGITVNIVSLEDLIILKLLADRPIDFIDAEVLVEENREDIDKDYLKDWAKKLGVLKKLKDTTQDRQ